MIHTNGTSKKNKDPTVLKCFKLFLCNFLDTSIGFPHVVDRRNHMSKSSQCDICDSVGVNSVHVFIE
jgi:hypothetical protein